MQHGKELRTESRAKIVALENAIRNDLDLIDLRVNHHFAHGTYTRELFIPAGTVATGKIHRHSCTNIVTKGRLLLISDEVEREVVAGEVFISGENVKKAVYALEDSIFINVFPWAGEPDIDLIEASLTISPENEIEVLP